MHQEKRVLRGDTPEARALLADGWSVIARSWGAGLLAANRSLGYVVDEEWWTLAPPVPE